MEHNFIQTPMILGKWLYVTASVDGITSDLILNTEKVIMMIPSINDNTCTVTVDCGGGHFSEVNLVHGFEEIVGLL